MQILSPWSYGELKQRVHSSCESFFFFTHLVILWFNAFHYRVILKLYFGKKHTIKTYLEKASKIAIVS